MTKQRVHRGAQCALLLPALFLLGCAAEALEGPPGMGSEDLTGDVHPLEDTIACDGATSVEVSITGTNVTEVTPVDLMLVVDESGSITPSEFEQQRNFMLDLVTELATLFDNGGRMGLVMFATDSRLVLGLNDDPAAVSAAISGVVQIPEWTCIGCGIADATAELAAQSSPDRAKVIVVLTDGFSNISADPALTPFEYVQATVADAEALGTELFAVGVGPLVSQPELEAIGSGPGDSNVFNVADFADLQSILAALAAAVVSPEATHGELTLVVNDAFVVLAAVVSAGAVNVVGNTIGWSIPQILDETVSLTYDIAHDPDGASGLKLLHDSVVYTDAEGNPLDLPDATVQVVGCDSDGDGIIDELDQCPDTEPGFPVNGEGCSIDQLCPCDADWPNHGQYVRCVTHAAQELRKDGLITGEEQGAIVSEAAQSDCGHNN
jgi:hypothetical protein